MAPEGTTHTYRVHFGFMNAVTIGSGSVLFMTDNEPTSDEQIESLEHRISDYGDFGTVVVTAVNLDD